MNDSASWTLSPTPVSLIAGIALVALAAWLAWRNARQGQVTTARRVVELLRVLAAFMLAVTLLKPELVRTKRESRTPVVQVLFDASGSMQTRDVPLASGEVVTREEAVQQAIKDPEWAALEPRYRVRFDGFAAPAEGAEDPATDLHAALARSAADPDNLRAVILLTDGDWNDGPNPSVAATSLRLRDVPIFAMQAGSNRYLPDVELSHIVAPAYALANESVSIPFTVQSRMDREITTTVMLRREDGTVAATREITIPPRRAVYDALNIAPEPEGEQTFTVEVPLQAGELLPENNRRDFRMAFRKETLKVLVIETLPRWEFRFLHNALWRDPGVEVKVLLFHPEIGMGQGSNYLPRFPEDMRELSEYDVVFLGDVGIQPGQLTTEQAEMLRGLVREQGSGLVFMPGMRGNQESLRDSPLDLLNPVELDPAKPTGEGFTLESKLALTTRGQDHLLTMLAPDPARNAEVWKGLPGFYWHAPALRARAGATVLAVHATSRGEFGRLPLLATQTVGNGKSLFMGTDSAWRWRRGVEDKFHYRFWGQVVRWMSHQRHLVNEEGIRFFYSPETPRRGQPVFLHATVFDQTGYPLKEGRVRAVITAPGGVVEELELSPGEEGWGVFTGQFTPTVGGEHSIRVASADAGRETETTVLVESLRRELIGRPARTAVLRELAEITKGRLLSPEDTAALVRELTLLPERRPQEQRFALWSHPLWAAALITLLALHWAGRKWLGLI